MASKSAFSNSIASRAPDREQGVGEEDPALAVAKLRARGPSPPSACTEGGGRTVLSEGSSATFLGSSILLRWFPLITRNAELTALAFA